MGDHLLFAIIGLRAKQSIGGAPSPQKDPFFLHSASAVLLRIGKECVKHSGLRGAVHRDLVKTGLLEPRWGKVFDRTFDNRQSGDYLAMWEFEPKHAKRLVYEAVGFVKEIDRLLGDPRADGESAGARAPHEP